MWGNAVVVLLSVEGLRSEGDSSEFGVNDPVVRAACRRNPVRRVLAVLGARAASVTDTSLKLRPRRDPVSAQEPPMLLPRPPSAPPSFHVMAKPTGAVCNLDCQYCFYLSRKSLYPGSRFRMGEDVLEAYVRQVIEGQSTPVVTIAWQGGEPTLMGLAFFRRAMALVERYRRPGQRIEHTIQTNGTLLTDEWAAFLAAQDVLVGISLDGPRALHDAYRVDKRGGPTFDKVIRGLDHLRRHSVRYNILCTVHAANVAHPSDVYRFLRDDCSASFIQFIPIVEHLPTPEDPEATSDRSVDPSQWGCFLVEVFDEWLAHDVGSVFVQTFEAALASWMGLPASLCVFAETCGNAVALEHNGDVYSCDHFVTPEHLLGNIRTTHLVELVASERQRRFGQAKRDTLPRYCLDCDVLFACWGECPKNRFVSTPDGEGGLNYLCEGYKAFFHHVDAPMRLMAGLLHSGRPAAEVTTALAKAPRNARRLRGVGHTDRAGHGR